MTTLAEELQKLSPSALIELFELDASAQGGGVSRFHAGTNALTQPVVWQGETYTPYPIEASGFETTGKGALPRPAMRVANIGGAIGAMCAATDDLIGAKLSRKRTFQRFLDQVNFPDAFYQAGHAVAFTNASANRTYFDSSGVMCYAAVNVPRFDHDMVTARTNLTTYSEQFDNAAWTKFNATISANVIAAPDGTMTADKMVENTSTSTHYVKQGGSVTGVAVSVHAKAGERSILFIGQTSNSAGFKFDLVAGTFANLFSTCTATMQSYGNGWYRCTVIGDLSAPYISLCSAAGAITYTGDGTSGLYLWGAQLEAGAAATEYIPTTTAAVTVAAPRGLLIEEARTNLLTRSAEFDNAAWGKYQCTVTPNAAVAPDGTTTADKLIGTLDTTAEHAVTQSYDYAGSTAYVYSVIAKAAELASLKLWVSSVSVAGGGNAFFDLTTGVVTSGAGGRIAALGRGWYCCALVFTTLASPVASAVRIDLGPVTGNGVSGIYIWGAQLEAGSFATSYIPTTTAAVTRAADNASLTGTAFSDWYRQDEGTFVTQHRTGGDVVAARAWRVANGDSSQRMQLVAAEGGNGGPSFHAAIDPTTQFYLLTGAATANTTHLTAAAYKANDSAFSRDGQTAGSDLSCVMPTVNRMYIGAAGFTGQTDYLDGHLARLTYYAERLSNADLQTLSGGGTVSASPAMSVDFTTGSLALSTQAPYNPEADPNAHLNDDLFFVNRKASENAVFVEFELVSALDVQGKKLPGRTVIQNVCTWRYRSSECGYAGGAVADKNDVATADANLDQCGKRLASCKLRFGAYAELPYGGFPGAGLQRR